MNINADELNRLLGAAVVDFGAAMHTPLVVIGDRLGFYKALAADGPMTSAELAKRTETEERYVREWASAQAAGGYVTYDARTGAFSLTPEQAFMLADDASPAFVPGAFQVALAASRIQPELERAFRTGEGIGWHRHDAGLFEGTERFFRPGYAANLVNAWIPALHGTEAALKRGIRVADVGCGHGASTILMAQAYPNSTFVGYDYHDPSIETARQRAKAAGVADRVTFEKASAKDYAGQGFGLVTLFDCLHDMGDPVGASRHIRESLASDGTFMLVEPFAGDRLEDNLNPVGRAFYSASTLICTPCSLDQEVGLALGAQAGEARLGEVVKEAGFSRFRRATETPFNIVFEAKA